MKRAFTLVELLVVVLIIGILTAIAVPMYQSAVDKTHWSTLLPTARALKNAEEAYLMATNAYTDNADALDVAATQGDATYELQMPGSDSLYAIRATTTKLPTVRLAQYLDDNAMRAGQLYCEASDGENGRGTKLCEKLLMGQELGTTDDGYTQYLLDQEVDKVTCEGVNRSWSNKQTKCYKTEKARCEGLGMPYNTTTQFCGYNNTSGNANNRLVIEEGGTCEGDVGTKSGCQYLQINEGGICVSHQRVADGNEGACKHSIVNGGAIICKGEGGYNNLCGFQSTFDGGICVGTGQYSCYNSSFTNGSICYAHNPWACTTYGYKPADFDETSCCCGNCHKDLPKCADRGKTCDPYYMDPNNFKD